MRIRFISYTVSFVLHLAIFWILFVKIYVLVKDNLPDILPKQIVFVVDNPYNNNKKTDTNILSLKFSEGKGKITKRKGYNWEEKLEVRFRKGLRKKDRSSTEAYKKTNEKAYYNVSKIPDNFDPNKAIALNFSSANFSSISSIAIPKEIYEKELKYKEDLMKYIRATIPKILRHLNLPIAYYLGAYPTGLTKILVMLDKMGNVLDVKVVGSFGFPSFDLSIVSAIKLAKNFGPPPKTYKYNRLYILYVVPNRNLRF